jgi:hypothetical protein
MATRLASRFTEELSPQIGDSFRLGTPPAHPMQGCQQTPRVPWRTEQVSGFHQAGEFSSRNEGNVSRAPASNDDRFLLIDDLIQNTGKVFP